MNRLIPNIFTLLNLFLGCMAIVEVMQPGLVMSNDGSGVVTVPERIYIASIYIGCAAVVDFLDGFVARLLKTPSELGKQLDSLADVVSFGVVPGLIAYQFLRLSYAASNDGLDTSMACLMPAFLIPCAGAFRLARFNIDTSQSYGFKGVPIPAAGLLVASFPLIYWYSNESWAINLMVNKWFWYAVIIVISSLMISTLPMMALKFKSAGIKDNWPKLLLVAIAIVTALMLHWLAVPLVFVVYVILSLSLKQKEN
ncbi:CDP-diacylglycerol---serine O-phosphatidyltransferase [Filimonas lacunae]|uniref:CDP-diacylglycerol---serine O-phosphatidyltransferase n=1 Tax=Filimonas lacunae TaxID=477680 RepID=A0A173M9Q5_9BACT|nr:CDP-alcohol phosphatidyltransferase family protein [Filimonas lacunae]BAV04273.1 CDP-diacylglycerol--serine O-phosphatidyltransferase [Filimonas lacunae]SIT30850.1 CDP-diacylglycerol---serine O-phosphatidyltransferase [Filimonas lacunae]